MKPVLVLKPVRKVFGGARRYSLCSAAPACLRGTVQSSLLTTSQVLNQPYLTCTLKQCWIYGKNLLHNIFQLLEVFKTKCNQVLDSRKCMYNLYVQFVVYEYYSRQLEYLENLVELL